MTDKPQLVKDLGEHGLLKKLQCFCPQDVVGDDGAILPTDPDKSLVVTTDVLVDGVHFSDRTTSAFDVGWRGTAANLSDLAAMGATPLGITVGLSLPGELEVDWVEELYRGIDACLHLDPAYSIPLVGGDICCSSLTSIAITALGQVDPQRAIRRSNATPGNAIVVTGLHGLSKAGLELLLDRSRGKDLVAQTKQKLIQAHQRPRPRLDVLKYLVNIPAEIAIAGMDSSDGLADAISQICHCSGVGATIERSNLSIFSGLTVLVGEKIAWEWLLYGGEDFELVLCLPPKYAVNLVEQLGDNAAIIGKITQNKEVILVDNIKNKTQEILNISKGFKHF